MVVMVISLKSTVREGYGTLVDMTTKKCRVIVTFWGKGYHFREIITLGGSLSLWIGLCTLCKIHQKNLGMGQTLPPCFWQCQDLYTAFSVNTSLSKFTERQI